MAKYHPLIVLITCLLGGLPGVVHAQDYALAIYAGRFTKGKWPEAILPGAEFSDATIVVAAGSWTFTRLFDGKLSFELEAQVGKHVGYQDHWEFNLPIIGFRWHRFPWDRYVATRYDDLMKSPPCALTTMPVTPSIPPGMSKKSRRTLRP